MYAPGDAGGLLLLVGDFVGDMGKMFENTQKYLEIWSMKRKLGYIEKNMN